MNNVTITITAAHNGQEVSLVLHSPVSADELEQKIQDLTRAVVHASFTICEDCE